MFNGSMELAAILHGLDRGYTPLADFDPDIFEQARATALLDESIASAQLAGAATPHEVAKQMLRTGQEPRDRDEWMIFNQCQALEKAHAIFNRPLDPTLVLELHRCITAGGLSIANASGRLRRDGEESSIVGQDGVNAYEPPPAGELPEQLRRICAFANGQVPDFFVHPVVRAITLHFWIAYDRPFLDGNGRAARTIFLWSMLKQGYRLFEVISVSSILLQNTARYATTFCQVETDDNDLTYFILAQAEAIRAAQQAFQHRLERRRKELDTAEAKLRGFADLSIRQQALIAHALRKPDTRYVITGHQRSHGVTHQTARDDLFDLVRRDLLTVGREGRVYIFRVVPDLVQRLQSEAKRRRPAARAADELPTALL